MAGIQNNILYGQGEKIQPSSLHSITLMQQLATDVGRINYTGNPEGVISANPSSLCHDPVSGNVYFKQTGTGNTGWAQIGTGTGTVTSVSGTLNRITSTGGATPQIDISASYVGQSSITTLGTVTTGTWNATAVGAIYGGTGQTTYATGDILYASAPNTLSKLAAGSNTNVLTLAGGVPTWAAPASSGIPTIGASTDKAIATWNGTGGNALNDNSGWTITSATGNMRGPLGAFNSPVYSSSSATGYGLYFTATSVGLAAGNSPGMTIDQNLLTTFTGFIVMNNGMRFTRSSNAGNLTVGLTATIFGCTSTAAPRTATLPQSGSNLAAGSYFMVKDESGGAGTNNITISVSGGTKTIDGATSLVIDMNYGYWVGYYDGTNYYTVALGRILPVTQGGTGAKTFTAYSVICAGTTATGAFQNVSGTGNAGDVLTSNGASTLPTWQPAPASQTSLGVSNIGIAYSGGTFTVQGANGSALSSTNVGYITMQSKANPGQLVRFAVTANQTFTDGSAGTTDNQRFGLVTAINWAQDIPFYLYAVSDDTNAVINFMISRNPSATTSPASASIGKTGAVVNVGQGDFFSLGNITVTDYDANPCLCIGSFRMQFVGATDSWTVQTLSNSDGVGQFNEQTIFTMPVSVNGSDTNTYFQNTGGTTPVFTTSNVNYKINRQGQVWYSSNHNICTNVPAGAVALNPTLPYAHASTASNAAYFGLLLANTGPSSFTTIGAINAGTAYVNASQYANTFNLTKAAIATSDSLAWTFTYPAY